MAWSTVSTEIQNPAGKRSNMTAKQIKYFGSKRQKAALKAKRSKTRHSAKRHAKRTAKRSNPVRRAAPKKRRKTSHHHSAKKRTKKSSHRSRTVKRNPPELVAFLAGNPATKGRKKVAHSKKKRKSSASHRKNAGSRRTTKKTRHSSRRRSNPAGISVKEMAYGGVGVLGGFFGSAAIPQMFLGTGNTGMTGYAVTAVAAVGLAIITHMVFPREKSLTFGVAAGGAANLLRRIITDQTPFGGYLSNAGMGDYMVANWGPPIMTDGLNSSIASIATNGGVAASSGINMLDYADIRSGGSRPC